MKCLKKLFISIIMLSFISQPISIFALEKTEMIYSNMNYKGEVKGTNINVSLTNLDKGDIVDYTYLNNVKNINSHEKFSRENDKLTWKSTGKDIFYEGQLNAELPIKVVATYYLDDQEVNPKKILGKSGNIKVNLKFENHEYDKNTNLYVPFVSTAIMMLSSDVNSKVEITNGKVISTGNQYIVSGISAPGLDENISLDEFRNINFNEISISYVTESFDITDIYIASSPKLLDDIDVSKLDKISNLSESLNTLSAGMNQVEDGANKLSDGSATLSDGMSQFSDGLKQAYDGSTKLVDGVNTLNSEVEYYYNILQLINRLFNNQETEEDLARLDPEIVTEIQKVRKTINDNQDIINEARSVVVALHDTYYGMQLDQFSSSEEVINYYENAGLGTDEIIKLVVCKESYEHNAKLMNYLENNNYSLLQGVSNLLDAIMNKADQAYNGTKQLSNGTLELSNGLQYLYEKSLVLDDGNRVIASSTRQLSEGIAKINNEGITTLNKYGTIASNYSLKIQKMIELSNNYSGFSGKEVDSTIFIYKLGK